MGRRRHIARYTHTYPTCVRMCCAEVDNEKRVRVNEWRLASFLIAIACLHRKRYTQQLRTAGWLTSLAHIAGLPSWDSQEGTHRKFLRLAIADSRAVVGLKALSCVAIFVVKQDISLA